MKLTKSEVIKLITAIETSCDGAFNYKNDTQYELLVEMWHDCFKDYPKEFMWQAVKQAIMNNEYAKQNWIGAVNKELQKLATTSESNDLELWGELNDTLYTVYDTSQYLRYEQHYDSAVKKLQEIYDGLSDDIKLYIINAGDLTRLAKLKYDEDDNISFNVEKQGFLKRLPDLRAHRKERKQAEQFLKFAGGGELIFLLGK